MKNQKKSGNGGMKQKSQKDQDKNKEKGKEYAHEMKDAAKNYVGKSKRAK